MHCNILYVTIQKYVNKGGERMKDSPIGGFVIAVILTIIFIILKLTEIITWSMLCILSPILIYTAKLFLTWLICGIIIKIKEVF